MLKENTFIFKAKFNNVHNLQMIARIAEITDTHYIIETIYDATNKWADEQKIPLRDMPGFVLRRQILNDKNIDDVRNTVAELLLRDVLIKRLFLDILKE